MDAQWLSALIAVVAAAIASGQVLVMRSVSRTELVREMVNLVYQDDFIKARKLTIEVKDEPYWHWDHTHIEAVDIVGYQLNGMAFIAKSSRSWTGQLIDAYGSVYSQQWRILCDYNEMKRVNTGIPRRWIYFEWLARETERRNNSPWRRSPWWERTRWLKLQEATADLNPRPYAGETSHSVSRREDGGEGPDSSKDGHSRLEGQQDQGKECRQPRPDS